VSETRDEETSYRALWERASEHMPLGVAENYRYWGRDESVFVARTKGGGFVDTTGREYVDFRLGYGPIILGYGDARVDDAVIACIRERGTVCGFSSELDARVVERLKRLCPNVEKLRFTNSGTEAVMGAVRTARGFTGREHIIQVEGGFHGLYDEMMWRADVEGWDPSAGGEPDVIPFGRGIPAASRELSTFVPLNDHEALTAAFAAKEGQVAALIVEVIQGNCGSIASTGEYMRHMRELCDANGALLIVDEVKTGFRVARGGVQELYGVRADLATYAKAMGNGYPVAAFGGRADVMDVIGFPPDGVVHGGTYSGNLIAMSAADACLTVLDETDALATVDGVGARVRDTLGEVFTEAGLEHRFAGPAAMFGVHFASEVPQNYRDWRATKSELYAQFARNLIHEGLMLEPDSREPWFICEAHTEVDLGWLREVAARALRKALDASV
jgi:glutamate-1-semialdehyde 2,1-aminomutase